MQPITSLPVSEVIPWDRNGPRPEILAVSATVFLLNWEEAEAQGSLQITLDGQPVDKRRAALRLGSRTMILFRLAPRQEGLLAVEREGQALFTLPVTEDPAADPASLLAGLDESRRAKLAGFILGPCRGLFRLAEDEAFALFCRRLIRGAVQAPPVEFVPRCQLAPGYALYQAPGPGAAGAIEAVYILDHRQVRQNPFRPAVAPDAVLLAAPPGLQRAGVDVVLVGRSGLLLARIPPAAGLPSLVAQAEAGALGRPERQYALWCLGMLKEEAIARTLQIFAPEKVRDYADPKFPVGATLEYTVGCGAAGLLAVGWLRDTHQLVSEAVLQSPFGEASLSAHWRRLPRPDLGLGAGRPGFIALLPIEEPIEILQHRLRLQTAGGAVEITPPARVLAPAEARNVALGSVAVRDLTDDLLASVIAPAVKVLHARVLAGRGTPEVVEIGPMAPASPSVTLLIPLYRNLGFLRLQLAAFAVDQSLRREAEILFVLDSPEQRAELVHLLRGWHVLTGLSFRVVVMSDNFGYAAANNAGAAHARGRILLLLNSDVIPVGPGWLAPLVEALGGAGAAGPKLLFDDGSLQHAGLTFERDFEGRWYNTHFFKGYPRSWPAANRPRSVPAVTGAALLVPRALFEEVGGFTEDYVIGDFEDSDLCLKIRSKGHDIRYAPQAELYHFERRSIALHDGYTRTLASAYNRRLHAERWGQAMADLT